MESWRFRCLVFVLSVLCAMVSGCSSAQVHFQHTATVSAGNSSDRHAGGGALIRHSVDVGASLIADLYLLPLDLTIFLIEGGDFRTHAER